MQGFMIQITGLCEQQETKQTQHKKMTHYDVNIIEKYALAIVARLKQAKEIDYTDWPTLILGEIAGEVHGILNELAALESDDAHNLRLMQTADEVLHL